MVILLLSLYSLGYLLTLGIFRYFYNTKYFLFLDTKREFFNNCRANCTRCKSYTMTFSDIDESLCVEHRKAYDRIKITFPMILYQNASSMLFSSLIWFVVLPIVSIIHITDYFTTDISSFFEKRNAISKAKLAEAIARKQEANNRLVEARAEESRINKKEVAFKDLDEIQRGLRGKN